MEFCFLTILALYLLVNYSNGAFLVPSLPGGRIVGGKEAKPHNHPYQVSLQMNQIWRRRHVCGGSILTEKFILTAGHCITELPFGFFLPLDVVAGAHSVKGTEDSVQIRRVADRVVHPSYKGGVNPYDIAVLRLQYPLEFNKQVQPVQLPERGEIPLGNSTLTGWGVLRSSGSNRAPEMLQIVELPIVPFAECNRAIENLLDKGEKNPLSEESNICTGPLGGGRSACNGDSGGPLVQYEGQEEYEEPTEPTEAAEVTDAETEEETQSDESSNEESSSVRARRSEDDWYDSPTEIGIVSWGFNPCASEGAPTVYTKVSAFIDFIEGQIYKQ